MEVDDSVTGLSSCTMEVDAQNDKNGNLDDLGMTNPYLQASLMSLASQSIGYQFMLPNVNKMSNELDLTKIRKINDGQTVQGSFGISTAIIPVGSQQRPSTTAHETTKR